MYFSTKKAVDLHSKDVHYKKQVLKSVCSRVNPIRIYDRNDSEAL